jgi:hypothetical protein
MMIPLLLASILTAGPMPVDTVDGVASWYGNPARYGAPAIAWYTRESKWGSPVTFYAAAGPKLRKLLGDPNPYHEHYPVIVTNRKTGASIRAIVVDWCGCSSGKQGEKLIDLSPAAFKALGVPLSRGIVAVSVTYDPAVASLAEGVVHSTDSAHGGASVRGWTDGPAHHRARYRVGAYLYGGYWYA